MAIYVKKGGVRNPAGTLLVTFLLGAAIGFSLCYALFGMNSDQEQGHTPIDTADESPGATSTTPIEGAAEATEEVVAAELASLTPRRGEEVWPGWHLFLAVNGTSLDADTAALLSEIRPGGIVLRAENIVDAAQTIALVADIKRAVGMGRALSDPPIVAIDQEGGRINPLGVDPAPSAEQLGRARDIDGARSSGRRYAEEAVARGIGVVLGPVLDVLAPGATVSNMADRVFGSDQELVALLGLAQADGIMEARAIPVAKYYPGIGTPKRIDGIELAVLEGELGRLAELMYPFAAAAEQGIPGILVGQVAVPTLDGQRPGRLAAASPVLVQRVLRQYWHYAGVVLADDVALNPTVEATLGEKAVVDSLAAGCDAVLFLDPDAARVRAAFTAIEDAIDTGLLTREQLLESMRRLDGWHVRLSEAREPEATPPILPEPAPAEIPEAPDAPIAEPEIPRPVPVPEPEAESVPVEEPTPDIPDVPAEEAPAPVVTPYEPAPDAVAESDAEEPLVEAGEAPPEAAGPMPEPAEPEPPDAVKPEPVPQPPNTERIVYEIQRGDSLGRIAVRHGVKQSDIMAWNAMEDTKILYGFHLIIYVPLPEEPTAEEAPAEETSTEEAAPEAPAVEESPTEATAVTAPEESAVEEPPTEATAVTAPEESAVEIPPVEQPAPAEAAASAPEAAAVEEPPTETPAPAEPTPEAVAVEEPPVEAPAPAEAAAETSPEAPAVEGPASEAPAAVESPPKEPLETPAAETPAAEAPAAEAPVSEEAAVDEPATEESPAEKRAPDAAGEPVEAESDAAEPEAAPAEVDDMTETYVVQIGDTAHGIARRHGTTVQKLVELNNLRDPQKVLLGQKLKVPRQP